MGDASDYALVETVSERGHRPQLCRERVKTECIRTTVFHAVPYRTLTGAEYSTASWVDWYNNRRLHGTLGMLTPIKPEAPYYEAVAREPEPETS